MNSQKTFVFFKANFEKIIASKMLLDFKKILLHPNLACVSIESKLNVATKRCSIALTFHRFRESHIHSSHIMRRFNQDNNNNMDEEEDKTLISSMPVFLLIFIYWQLIKFWFFLLVFRFQIGNTSYWKILWPFSFPRHNHISVSENEIRLRLKSEWIL